MSEENDKEYIKDEASSLKTEETIIILSLVEEIMKLEEKIKELKNSVSNQDNPEETQKEINNLKKTKNELNKQINELSVNLLLDISNKENLIKKKSYQIKDINKKINNYKNILSTYNTLSFNSPLLKKYISSNKMNQFLSDEQIDDIMSKTQTIYNNENLIQKYEKEYITNKEELNNIENDRKKILQKINEIKENLKMMKEEKITIKNELVNYISLRETLESIIKVNLPSLLVPNKEENNEEENKIDVKNFEKKSFSSKEINNQNRVNTINSISEEDNENDNEKINVEYIDISDFNLNNNNNLKNITKKNWDEIINLYKYEFFYLEPTKISTGISNEIFDTLSAKIISENNAINNNESLRNSIKLESKNTANITNNFLDKAKLSSFKNNRYGSGARNPMIFSCESPIIKKTKTNLFLFNDINDCKKEIQVELKSLIQNYINDNNNISIDKFIEQVSDMLINKLNEYGYFLNKKNLMIYLSCFFKKSFYECMISLKLKFINKDYKSIKKNKKKKIENLQDQLTKLNTRYETIKNTIILQENKIKLLNKIENQDNKKIKDNNEINNIGNLKLTLDEQNYIQLCRKANSFINEKNEIEREIEENENDKKLKKYQGEIKINSLKNEINDINTQINTLENESFNKKVKIDEEIAKDRKLIMEKYSKIKEYLEKYKNKCLNNDDINIYNDFIDKISSNIDNKYYKSLLDLEKYNLNSVNRTPSQSRGKSKERKTTIDNLSNINMGNDLLNRTSHSNIRTHRRTSSDLIKPFYLKEDFLSPINNNKTKNYYNNKNEKTYDFNSTSKKESTIFNESKNRVKNSNYINVFDSCNNLNNYFFQFQSPSTVIRIDDNKKFNNYFLNNTNKPNNKKINLLSYSSPFSSNSKLSESNQNQRIFNSKNNLKPTNLINNLKYCVSDKKKVDSEIKYSNKTINIGEFQLISKNKKNIYTSKPKSQKNVKMINNLLSNYSKEKTDYIIIDKNSKNNIINSLFKRTFCYFRILNNKNAEDNNNIKKYNPFENLSISQLCKSPYNYIKSTLNFDKKEDMIIINPSNQLESINIKIDKIENTCIDYDMKTVIDIYNGYKKYKNKYNDDNINKYIKEIKKGNISYIHLKDEEIKKIYNNKNFVFNISIKNKKIIEFLFCSYEEFILWNNAICFFIKNNNEFSFKINSRNKFEYP